MSRSNITNVATLDALSDAMKDYGAQSLAVVRDFASQLRMKKESLKHYRNYLENRINSAREELSYCHYIQSISEPQFRPSCRWEADRLERTQSDLVQYKHLMAQLDRAYEYFENKLNTYSNYVEGQLQSSIGKLNNEISEAKKYMNNC